MDFNERASSHIAQVFHGHPGSGHIKVWRLTPLTLHIFVVIFLVLQLWGRGGGDSEVKFCGLAFFFLTVLVRHGEMAVTLTFCRPLPSSLVQTGITDSRWPVISGKYLSLAVLWLPCFSAFAKWKFEPSHSSEEWIIIIIVTHSFVALPFAVHKANVQSFMVLSSCTKPI